MLLFGFRLKSQWSLIGTIWAEEWLVPVILTSRWNRDRLIHSFTTVVYLWDTCLLALGAHRCMCTQICRHWLRMTGLESPILCLAPRISSPGYRRRVSSTCGRYRKSLLVQLKVHLKRSTALLGNLIMRAYMPGCMLHMTAGYRGVGMCVALNWNNHFGRRVVLGGSTFQLQT